MKKILTIASTSFLAAALSLSAFAQTAAPAKAADTAVKTTDKVKAAVMPAPTAQEISDAKAKGLVWANLNSKVYHSDGAMYGATKHGKFMTKDEAEKAGFHAAKEHSAKKSAAKKTS